MPFSLALRLAIVAALALPIAAAAQKKDSTLKEAGRIAKRPGQDVGIIKTKVPPVLARAADAPYTLRGMNACSDYAAGIRRLNTALGPDFGEEVPVTGTKAGAIAKAAGVAITDSIIPFRGLVREVSGAAAAQRRVEAGIYAGLARRGFLRGMMRAKGC